MTVTLMLTTTAMTTTTATTKTALLSAHVIVSFSNGPSMGLEGGGGSTLWGTPDFVERLQICEKLFVGHRVSFAHTM